MIVKRGEFIAQNTHCWKIHRFSLSLFLNYFSCFISGLRVIYYLDKTQPWGGGLWFLGLPLAASCCPREAGTRCGMSRGPFQVFFHELLDFSEVVMCWEPAPSSSGKRSSEGSDRSCLVAEPGNELVMSEHGHKKENV